MIIDESKIGYVLQILGRSAIRISVIVPDSADNGYCGECNLKHIEYSRLAVLSKLEYQLLLYRWIET